MAALGAAGTTGASEPRAAQSLAKTAFKSASIADCSSPRPAVVAVPVSLKEYQQKNSPGATAGAKKKRKTKEGSRPETPTNDDRQSPENVSVPLFLPDNPSASCFGFQTAHNGNVFRC
uniref:Uncharacterized protein n=1 Tax=Meleagris gallopavo TaxID=9103 RepID=A0A803YGX1_MELGA